MACFKCVDTLTIHRDTHTPAVRTRDHIWIHVSRTGIIVPESKPAQVTKVVVNGFEI